MSIGRRHRHDEPTPERSEDPAAVADDDPSRGRLDAEGRPAALDDEARDVLGAEGADPDEFFPSIPHPF